LRIARSCFSRIASGESIGSSAIALARRLRADEHVLLVLGAVHAVLVTEDCLQHLDIRAVLRGR
jgi:hypothetical protein